MYIQADIWNNCGFYRTSMKLDIVVDDGPNNDFRSTANEKILSSFSAIFKCLPKL